MICRNKLAILSASVFQRFCGFLQTFKDTKMTLKCPEELTLMKLGLGEHFFMPKLGKFWSKHLISIFET
jgi:hypothetical protein